MRILSFLGLICFSLNGFSESFIHKSAFKYKFKGIDGKNSTCHGTWIGEKTFITAFHCFAFVSEGIELGVSKSKISAEDMDMVYMGNFEDLMGGVYQNDLLGLIDFDLVIVKTKKSYYSGDYLPLSFKNSPKGTKVLITSMKSKEHTQVSKSLKEVHYNLFKYTSNTHSFFVQNHMHSIWTKEYGQPGYSGSSVITGCSEMIGDYKIVGVLSSSFPEITGEGLNIKDLMNNIGVTSLNQGFFEWAKTEIGANFTVSKD